MFRLNKRRHTFCVSWNHVRDSPSLLVSTLTRSRAHFKETFRLGEATRSGVSERERFSELRRFLNADDAHNGNDEGCKPLGSCVQSSNQEEEEEEKEKKKKEKKGRIWLTMLNTIRQLHVVNRPRPSKPSAKVLSSYKYEARSAVR